MKRPSASIAIAIAIAAASLVITGCGQAATAPTPTKAPAAPAPTKAAEPTKPAAAPQPTAVPAKKVDYPQKGKTITIIVPNAAGGSMDIGTRILASYLEKEFGTPIEVVNKPGATTQLGNTELANARPDGFTLSQVSLPAAVITYLDAERKATYTRRSFQPISMYNVEPIAIAVKSDSPWKGIKDLVDAAKARPGQVKVGTAGLMGGPHLAFLSFQRLAGLNVSYVHFDGAPSITALLGGHVDATVISSGSLAAGYKAGQLRVLGVMDSQPYKYYPEIKTLEDQGFKAYGAIYNGFVAPAATPGEIVGLIDATIKKGMATDEVKKKNDDAMVALRYMDQTQFATLWGNLETELQPLIPLAKQ